MSLKRALEKALNITSSNAAEYTIPKDLPKHLKTGAEGEQLAAEYLAARGYTILSRNIRYRIGEIDIVARDKDEIVFAEVRTRSLGYLLPADRSVGPDKLKKLLQSARTWTENENYDGFWRIDLIAITIDAYGNSNIEHIKDITEATA